VIRNIKLCQGQKRKSIGRCLLSFSSPPTHAYSIDVHHFFFPTTPPSTIPALIRPSQHATAAYLSVHQWATPPLGRSGLQPVAPRKTLRTPRAPSHYLIDLSKLTEKEQGLDLDFNPNLSPRSDEGNVEMGLLTRPASAPAMNLRLTRLHSIREYGTKAGAWFSTYLPSKTCAIDPDLTGLAAATRR
jgi:hypothetical protein